MIVKHNKTGNLYQLIDDECKSKINGKWVDAVIYQGKDKESGKTKCFVREKSDFDSHFTEVGGIDLNLERSWLFYQIYTLKEVAEDILEIPLRTSSHSWKREEKKLAIVQQNNKIKTK